MGSDSEFDENQRQARREELFRLVWSMPSEQVAKKLGISGVALAKRCTRLGVAKPPRGYWAKYKDSQDRPIPPLAAYQEAIGARLKHEKIQPGLHLPERRLELFKKAADRVLDQNPELGRYEIKGSRIIHIDPPLASAALTSAAKHFPELLPSTPFVAARRVAAGLIDALLPLVADNVLVFQKSEKSVFRTEKEFIVVRISENLLRHIANAHQLISNQQLAFSAIPLNNPEYCQSVRYLFEPGWQWIARVELCVSATHIWLRVEQKSPDAIYETESTPIEQLAPLSFIPKKSRNTHTESEVQILREDWDLLQTLLEAEDMYEMSSSIVYDLQDADLHTKLARAMKLWWPDEQFHALRVLQEGLLTAEQRIEQWEEELATAKQRICQKTLGIRLGDIMQVMEQGKPRRIQVERLDVFKTDHGIIFTAHGKLFRKDGMVGKRHETIYFSLPATNDHQSPGQQQNPGRPTPWKWSW